jgi:hypothetical protein
VVEPKAGVGARWGHLATALALKISGLGYHALEEKVGVRAMLGILAAE